MKLGLVIDLDTCVGCHACAIACKEWNGALRDQRAARRLRSLRRGRRPASGSTASATTRSATLPGSRRRSTCRCPACTARTRPASPCARPARRTSARTASCWSTRTRCMGCNLLRLGLSRTARASSTPCSGTMKKCTLCVDRIHDERAARGRAPAGLRARLPGARAPLRRLRRPAVEGVDADRASAAASACSRNSATSRSTATCRRASRRRSPVDPHRAEGVVADLRARAAGRRREARARRLALICTPPGPSSRSPCCPARAWARSRSSRSRCSRRRSASRRSRRDRRSVAPPPSRWRFVVAGLGSSTLHLANPRNAWRSASRFRTSWLSREAVFALALLPVAAGFAWALYVDLRGAIVVVLALATLVLAWIVLVCTAMIYASLKPIRAWHTRRVPLGYVVLGHASGAVLLVALLRPASDAGWLPCAGIVLLLAALLVKVEYWRHIRGTAGAPTLERAIGVDQGVRPPGTAGQRHVRAPARRRPHRRHVPHARVPGPAHAGGEDRRAAGLPAGRPRGPGPLAGRGHSRTRPAASSPFAACLAGHGRRALALLRRGAPHGPPVPRGSDRLGSRRTVTKGHRAVTALSQSGPSLRVGAFRTEDLTMRKPLIPFVVAAFAAVAAPLASAADITGAGATFPYPIYAKWAEAYKKATGIGHELPVDRLGRRHRARSRRKTVDFGASDMPLKAEDLAKEGLVQFPADHRRRRPGHQPRGHHRAPAQADRPGAGRHLPRQDQALGRQGDRRPQPRREAAGRPDHGRAPLGRLRHHVPVDRLPVEDEPGVEDEGRRGHRGVLARRRGRQGQRGRRGLRAADQGLDRLRRVRVREEEQHLLRGGAQPRRRLRRAGRRDVPGRRRWRRLEGHAGHGGRADRPAGQGQLADRRRELHPHARQAGQAAERGRGHEVLRLVVQERPGDGGRTRLRARCPTP